MGSSKEARFILKLIKGTRVDAYIWSSRPPHADSILDPEKIIGKIYETEVNDRTIKVFKYKFKHYHDEYDYEYAYRIRLELIDDAGFTEYEFEHDSSLWDLYEVIREQASDVTDFLDEFLK